MMTRSERIGAPSGQGNALPMRALRRPAKQENGRFRADAFVREAHTREARTGGW